MGRKKRKKKILPKLDLISGYHQQMFAAAPCMSDRNIATFMTNAGIPSEHLAKTIASNADAQSSYENVTYNFSKMPYSGHVQWSI